MYQNYKSARSISRGLVLTVVAHILLVWLAVSGTARNGIKAVAKSLQAEVIQEVLIAPPPPPPPPKEVKPEIKSSAPDVPPAVFIPKSEVAAPPSDAPVIAATTTMPLQSASLTPPPPLPTPAKVDIAVTCPKQVPPEMPRRAAAEGVNGTVRAQARIKGGQVIEVSILYASPPRIFNNAVIAAMKQYQCVDQGEIELIATQEFSFKVEE